MGPGFETLPADRMGLAVPVIVGGRVVAVVYADGVALDGHERLEDVRQLLLRNSLTRVAHDDDHGLR